MADSTPSSPAFRSILVGLALLLSGCHGGENKSILKDMLTASACIEDPPPTGSVVFLKNTSASQGDILVLDVMMHVDTATLDFDDIDLVLRYDATFLQVLSVSGTNTLPKEFGTCNTVNPFCGLGSPVCLNNRVQANGGGARLCRISGCTACVADTDCTASDACDMTPPVVCPTLSVKDACGSFGLLQASFAILTGPNLCSNNTQSICSTDPDCRFCSNDPTLACTTDTDCGTTNMCQTGTCLPGPQCQSVVVSGTPRLTSLTLRVIREGKSEIRFVVSPSNPNATASFVHKNRLELPVMFFPNVDATDLANRQGEIAITGTL